MSPIRWSQMYRSVRDGASLTIGIVAVRLANTGVSVISWLILFTMFAIVVSAWKRAGARDATP
jgi:hypothetical protein